MFSLVSKIKNIKSFPNLDKDEKHDINGYQRIYLYHIRKTGGTSLNHMFLNLIGDDPNGIYTSLADSETHKVKVGDKTVVGWNKKAIEAGNYYYAFSHMPMHEFNLPSNTFTLTCLRDPIARVLSHYKMLKDYQEKNIKHPCMRVEGKWLGESFDEFIENIPKEHLLNQLYMFSSSFDIDEALMKVRGLSHCFFTEEFDQGVCAINEKLNLNLRSKHIRTSGRVDLFESGAIDVLKKKLQDEYLFINILRQGLSQ